MRYLVLSDTHGMTQPAESLIRFFRPQIDGVIHLGDLIRDAEALAATFRNDPALAFLFVPGNCDSMVSPSGKLYKRTHSFTAEGVTVFMTHGDQYHVNYGVDALVYGAKERSCQVALYGHTHVPMMETVSQVLVLNPGSVNRPRGGSKPSFALLELEKGKAAASLLNVEDFIR